MKRYIALPVFCLSLALAGCQENEEEAAKQEAVVEVENQETAEASAPVEEDEATEEADTGDVVSAIEQLNVPEPPSAAEEFISQEPGMLNGERLEISDERKEQFLEAFEDVPALPENATEEEMDAYFNYIYALTAFSLPDPKQITDQMKFALSGTPEAEERFQFKENYNVEIILDASGSMGAYAGDRTRMEQAKEEINSFLSTVPEEANVSLRVYGHEGTGDEADKAKSCAAIEEVYERGAYEAGAFEEALDQFEPAGWTPVAGALESAAESFKELDGEENTNLIYLVSDGIETCDGDPVEAAKSFADSNMSPIINVIGFNADSETQAQLKEVAESADGMFTNVSNADQLAEEFKRSEDVLRKWKRWKLDASIDLLGQSNDLSFAIIDWSNKWSANVRDQKLSLYNANRILRDEGKLTLDQQRVLEDKADEVDDRGDEVREQVRTELETMLDEGVAEMEKQIEEMSPEDAE
ncbi:VWA domain-containing protein [Jeotgalibacillus sp. JSM ZJ347]|uniref:vWA domain-containing protein n=1 Tax=Jeotgalibacillus sp. JSM ZJ347 TaxID=3342117 RepID=UPI0035A89F47